MAVSVIISNFNGARYLPKLLETLEHQRDVECEIIVVDRNSSDDSLAILRQRPEVKVVNEPPETGLVSGYDTGAKHAQHEHLFFCNEDMWFEPDCLMLLEKHLDEAAGVVATDPWQWTYDGKVWIHGGTRFVPCRWNFNSPYPRRAIAYAEQVGQGELTPFPCAGAFMMCRKAYDAVGGWDRDFFLDYEDIDLFIRVWQAGWRCIAVPEARVYHAVNVSNTKTITGGLVSKRRFISGRATVPIIGLKYFTAAALAIPFLCWSSAIAKDLIRFRMRLVWWHLLATRELFRRLGSAIKFRKCWKDKIRRRPGQQFFLLPEFTRS